VGVQISPSAPTLNHPRKSGGFPGDSVSFESSGFGDVSLRELKKGGKIWLVPHEKLILFFFMGEF
jgi:hypothetical protein